MSSHTESRTKSDRIEIIATQHILPWLRQRSQSVTETAHSELLQKMFGDWVQLTTNNIFRTIELKAEESNRYGNFFFEQWSNRQPPYWTPGWMCTCHAEWLFYYFVEERTLYVMDFGKLKMWAFGDGRPSKGEIYGYPVKPQKKYEQLNATWGWCVPIETLLAFDWCCAYRSTAPFEFEKIEKLQQLQLVKEAA